MKGNQEMREGETVGDWVRRVEQERLHCYIEKEFPCLNPVLLDAQTIERQLSMLDIAVFKFAMLVDSKRATFDEARNDLMEVNITEIAESIKKLANTDVWVAPSLNCTGAFQYYQHPLIPKDAADSLLAMLEGKEKTDEQNKS